VRVFSDIEHNPASHALSDALDRHLGQGAARVKRREHSLSDVVELQALFRATDFADVRVETVVRPFTSRARPTISALSWRRHRWPSSSPDSRRRSVNGLSSGCTPMSTPDSRRTCGQMVYGFHKKSTSRWQPCSS